MITKTKNRVSKNSKTESKSDKSLRKRSNVPLYVAAAAGLLSASIVGGIYTYRYYKLSHALEAARFKAPKIWTYEEARRAFEHYFGTPVYNDIKPNGSATLTLKQKQNTEYENVENVVLNKINEHLFDSMYSSYIVSDKRVVYSSATPIRQVITIVGFSPEIIKLVAECVKATHNLPVEIKEILLGGISYVDLQLHPRCVVVIYCPIREGDCYIGIDMIMQPLHGDSPYGMNEKEWRARKLGSLQTSRMDNGYWGAITLLGRRLIIALVDETRNLTVSDYDTVAVEYKRLGYTMSKDFKKYRLYNAGPGDTNYIPIVISLDKSSAKLNIAQTQAIAREMNTSILQPLFVSLTEQERGWFTRPK